MTEHDALHNIRILVTRSTTQSGELSARIRQAGGIPFEFPVIALREPADPVVLNQLDQALHSLEQYDWVLFTSVNGVEFFFRRLRQLKIDIRTMHNARLAAVGPRTLAALEERSLYAEELPDEYVAESLLESIAPKLTPSQKVLLPRANIARKMLPLGLEELGMQVTDAVVYDNHLADEGAEEVIQLLRDKQIDVISFTSSSTVRNFMRIVARYSDEPAQLIGKHVLIACIGKLTAATAEEHGLQVHCLAKEATIPSMMEAIVDRVNLRS